MQWLYGQSDFVNSFHEHGTMFKYYPVRDCGRARSRERYILGQGDRSITEFFIHVSEPVHVSRDDQIDACKFEVKGKRINTVKSKFTAVWNAQSTTHMSQRRTAG